MTVNSETSRVSYAGNGATVTFSIPYYFISASDLKLVLTAADGSTSTPNATITGAGNPAGGSATLSVAPASGATLTIYRDPPLTQTTSYAAGRFPAASHERALDRAVMIMQRLKSRVDDQQAQIDGIFDDVEEAKDAAVLAVQGQGTTSVAAVSGQGTTSIAAVAAQGVSSIALVAAQGATSVAAVVAQQATSIAAVAAAVVGTSTTSVAIGTGAKSFMTQTGKPFAVGQRLRIANDGTNWMEGAVSAYNSGTGALDVTVDLVGGSGTFAAWNIVTAGVRGATGAQGDVSAAQLAAAVDPITGKEQVIGESGAASGSVGNATLVYYPFNAVPEAGFITGIVASYQTANQKIEIIVANDNGGGTVDIISRTPVGVTSAGINTITGLAIPVSAGNVVGFFSGSALYQDTTGGLGNYTSAIPTTGTARTLQASRKLKANFTFINNLALDQDALIGDMGHVETVGVDVLTTGSQYGANSTFIDRFPVRKTGVVTGLVCNSFARQTGTIYVMSKTTANVFSVVGSGYPVRLRSGLTAVHGLNIPVSQGQFLAIHTPSALTQQTNSRGNLNFSGTASSGHSPNENTTVSAQFQFTVASGAQLAIERAKHQQGTGALITAEKTGSSDATASFTSARVESPSVYVPDGVYSVTALPRSGEGMHGPGEIYLNGDRYPIPFAPNRDSMQLRIRAALAQCIGDKSAAIVIGDSVTSWYTVSAAEKHWTTRLVRFLNAGISTGDHPIFASPFLAFQRTINGITVTGFTNGTRGPNGNSMILAPGGVISFAGAYEYVDVFYRQTSGAGDLAFAYNGGAAYKTVTCAGSEELDKSTYNSANTTGQAASGTYTITNTGAGNVEVTGIIRLGPKTAGTPSRFYMLNAATGGSQFGTFTYNSTTLASAVKQAKVFGGTLPPLFIALGSNSFALGYSAAKSAVESMVSTAIAAGVGDIYAIIPSRPTNAHMGMSTHDESLGGFVAGYRGLGIPMIKLNGIDMVNINGLADDVHPNDFGHERMFQTICETLTDF